MKAFLTLFCAASLVTMIGSGCASTQMKGTPFYTGEYEVRRGPAEDRVNLWPLLYYREPALSLLWPIGEVTEDHLAIRPLMSIYGRHTDHPVYNVLWPLARFDSGSHSNRIFPVFWGPDYFIGFPLYWHFGDPWGTGGYDGLLPLWSHRSLGEGQHSTHVLWPIFHRKYYGPDNTGWRVWPLVGSYDAFDTRYRYRFAAWPLAHQWAEKGGPDGGSCVVPLYFHNRHASDSLFLSLPYSRGKYEDRSWETVLPLYHRRKTETSRSFYSLLYSSGNDDEDASSWNLTVPLWYSKSSPDERLVATLLGGYWREDDETRWLALPLLGGGRYSDNDGDIWLGGPLAHAGWSEEGHAHHVFPFYYRSKDASGRRFYSLLWSSGDDVDGSSWQMLFPLLFRHHDSDSQTLITPLFAQGSDDAGETHWRSVVPLLFNRRTADSHLVATILGGYLERDDSLSWLAYPLLSGGRLYGERGSFWGLGPIVHAKWSPEGNSHHVLPLYYWNGISRTFVSLPVARWERGDTTTTLVPPLASWLTSREERSDLWLLGPLAHLSWGEDATTSHIFPLYYHNRETGSMASLLAASWESNGVDYRLYPPLLSLYTEEDETKTVYGLLGLFRQQWGQGASLEGHLIPLYAYKEDDYFLTLLFGAKGGDEGFMYPFTPLAGVYRGNRSGGWLFPLWSHRHSLTTDYVDGRFLWGEYWRHGTYTGSGIFPVYKYENFGKAPECPGDPDSQHYEHYGKRVWTLPYCWYRNETTFSRVRRTPDLPKVATRRDVKAHGCFPLWSYKRRERLPGEQLDVNGSLLLLLYDYHRKVRQDGRDVDDYTRARVLWRLWHFERADGNVSVDVFPGVTYDSKTNGFKKVSFLWRFFRYERGPTGKKMDLLFVPLMRKGSDEEAH